MIKINPELDYVNTIVKKALSLGIAQVNHEGDTYDGKHILVQGKKLIFLGNCSYLGLDQDNRIKAAAIRGVQQYGSFFSSSRAFVELELNELLEAQLSKMFNRPCVITPTTTLGHLSALPVFISSTSAIIMDIQVHHSVKTAATMCKANGTKLYTIGHHDIDRLESHIKNLQGHESIWYLIDGIYSMYGDGAHMHKIINLLNKYSNFYCYVDDSHGMSWTGKHGTGYAMDRGGLHNKVVYIMSMSKSFGTGGSVLVLPNEDIKNAVRNCGSTLIFSGPMSPSALKAGLASAQIHLSEEIKQLQSKLTALIEYFNQYAQDLNIPLMNTEMSPIRYIPLGKTDRMLNVLQYLISKGFFVNGTAYPSVPKNNAGLRITITNHLDNTIIENLLKEIKTVLNIFPTV